MKQPHHALNTLNNNEHLVVAFQVDLPPDVEVTSYGVPRLLIDGIQEAVAVLVPAPTEGPGRFALDFRPAFNIAFGHYAVEVEIDVVLSDAGEVTLDRTIHFFVLHPSGDGISVTPQAPVDQDEAMKAASAAAADALSDASAARFDTLAGAGSGVPGPASLTPPPSAGPIDPPPAPEPLADEQRATAAAVAEQAQATLNQSAADQPAAGEQPQI